MEMLIIFKRRCQLLFAHLNQKLWKVVQPTVVVKLLAMVEIP